MRRWLIRLGLLAAVVVAIIWLRGILTPGPATLIRRQVAGLARAASVSPGESPLARAANAQKVVAFFAPDAELTLHLQGERTLNGRDELLEVALAARAALPGLKVEFVDVQVAVDPGGATATALLTAKATSPGEKDFLAQELAISWRRTAPREWQIERVETIRTLL